MLSLPNSSIADTESIQTAYTLLWGSSLFYIEVSIFHGIMWRRELAGCEGE
jgi:hypothetical protein